MSIIRVVMLKELLDTFRDRRTLVVSVLVPLLMMPVMMYALNLFSDDADYPIAVSFNARSDTIMQVLDSEPLVVLDVDDPIEALADGDVELLLTVDRIGDKYTVQARYVRTHASQQALQIVTSRFEALNRELAGARLLLEGLDPGMLDRLLLNVEVEDVRRAANFASVLLPLVVIVWATVGAMYPAADVTAGEKERRTLESLLMVPASDAAVISGKFLAVLTVTLITTVLAIISTVISSVIGDIDLSLRLSEIPVFMWALSAVVVVVSTSMLMAATTMSVSTFARSFREAQTYLTPIFMIVVLPAAVLAVMPEFADRSTAYLIPYVNNTFIVSELARGIVNVQRVIQVLVSSVIITVWLVGLSAWLLRQETSRSEE